KQKSDIYYNPWTDLDFDQNNQQSKLDALPIKEIPIEPKAVQLELLQPQVASGQALGYPND
ncbi:39347_t:CDS:2, partial [Gigaspora margarita]